MESLDADSIYHVAIDCYNKAQVIIIRIFKALFKMLQDNWVWNQKIQFTYAYINVRTWLNP